MHKATGLYSKTLLRIVVLRKVMLSALLARVSGIDEQAHLPPRNYSILFFLKKTSLFLQEIKRIGRAGKMGINNRLFS
jgi:hypothetical protein